MKRVLSSLALAGALAASPALNAITYTYNPGVLHDTNAFATLNTTGAEMAGMGVHVEYVDGGSYDTTWQFLSAGNGGVDNADLLFKAGNTGNNTYAWFLQNRNARAIRSISLDGQPGNTVFDVSFPFGNYLGPNFIGTAGTGAGREVDLHPFDRDFYDGISVTYSDAVGLGGAAPIGDVFRRMTIELALNRPLYQQGFFEFRQDTDSIAFGSVLAPSSVPEGGATLAMLCAGLMVLAAGARRRAVQA